MPYRASFNKDEGDLLTGTRVCRTCFVRKPMSRFQWATGKTCRVRVCTDCKTNEAKEKRKNDRKGTSRRAFINNLRSKYGMTEDDYLLLWRVQEGSCAICRSEFGSRKPHVDHNHETGEIRGLLCFTCNTAIGKLGDDPELLRAAINYLERKPPKITRRTRRLSSAERSAIHSQAAKKQHGSPNGKDALARRSAASRGENNPASILTDAEALEIVSRYRAKEVTQKALAEEYGCSKGLVSLIVLGKVRRAIKPEHETYKAEEGE